MYVAFDRDCPSRCIPTRVISYLMAALAAVTTSPAPHHGHRAADLASDDARGDRQHAFASTITPQPPVAAAGNAAGRRQLLLRGSARPP